MKKLIHLTSSIVFLTAGLQATVTYSPQTIREFANYTLVGTWDGGDAVEKDAGDESLDANLTTPGYFASIYGDISGNTICRSDFKTQIAAAYAAGLGGVIDFEDANLTYSADGYSAITRTGADNINAGGLITISKGTQWWYEGDYNVGDANGAPSGAYRGKQTAAFDGTGPSGPDRFNPEAFFFITQASSGSLDELGTYCMGQTSSFDLDFNPADKVVVVGFAALNWANFQSQQDVSKPLEYPNYPNIHAIATFTNGATTVEQMAVGLSHDTNPGNDYYFGFEAPSGYYLENLLVYSIGNTARIVMGIDDLGFIVENPSPPAAVLAAEDVTITTNGTGVDVSFLSGTGLLYTLEESSDLNPPWCDLPGPITGDGTVKTFNVDPAPAAGKAFYRVRSE
jgi:hypothetical protein